MKRKYFLKKPNEINAVFKSKNYKGNKYISLHYFISEEQKQFKYMISIGKKYGNAVLRNKAKRRVRSIIYKTSQKFIDKLSLAIVIKPEFINLTYNQIEENLTFLLQKAKILKEHNNE